MLKAIYGHRGYPVRFPENSLAGFAYACAHGVDGLELDVQMTQDGQLVVMHDETLARTTGAPGAIGALPLATVQQAHLANHEPVPTLAQVLRRVAPYPVQLNLELKTNHVRYPGIEAATQAAVVAHGVAARVCYSSFNPDSLAVMHALAPEMPLALLAEGLPATATLPVYLDALHLAHVQPALALPQRLWTVNDPQTMRAAFAAPQVTGVITDCFEAAQAMRSLAG
ncbi:glycerophosphodiester phosphodiesterase [Lacticaseibacillus absianus]|uniref:glycerophosphodiester phosphodiesterase n=1 Tax=Lacticaseibacillus absianus TaxID=2729623 RepID=UPI0015CA75DA|nr:glycerophosphodiester phosphodiesterase family protein [Lacticaseibacillus absianus]